MYLRPQSKTFGRKRKLAKLIVLAGKGKYSAPKLAEMFGCNKKTLEPVVAWRCPKCGKIELYSELELK